MIFVLSSVVQLYSKTLSAVPQFVEACSHYRSFLLLDCNLVAPTIFASNCAQIAAYTKIRKKEMKEQIYCQILGYLYFRYIARFDVGF